MFQKIKLFFSYLVVATAASISTYQGLMPSDPFEHKPVQLENGCVVDSVIQTEVYEACSRLRNHDIWSHVILFQYKGPDGNRYGHAICVFVWRGRSWIYDPDRGSWLVSDLDIRVAPLEDWFYLAVPEGSSEVRIHNVI